MLLTLFCLHMLIVIVYFMYTLYTEEVLPIVLYE